MGRYVQFHPDESSSVTYWEWQSGVPLPTGSTTATTTSEELPPQMDDITTTATTTATSPEEGMMELSAQPVWDQQVRITSQIPINETHTIIAFEGNGTMTVPDTGETINVTNKGTAIAGFVPQANNNTVISYGRGNVFSVDDGDTLANTFFDTVQYDPTTVEGKGVVTAVFDANATGSLAPFNGMLVVGTHEEDPGTQTVTIRLWEWEGRIPLLSSTTMSNATTDDTTATTALPEQGEGAGEE